MAQTGIFALGGLETSSMTLTSAVYFLSKHPKVQEELHQEVKACLDSTGGTPDYDQVKELPLLSAVLDETLRLKPPITKYQRVCTRDSELPGGLRVSAGTLISIPIYASHRHEDFFDHPDEFRPERFFEGNKDNIHPIAYRQGGSIS